MPFDAEVTAESRLLLLRDHIAQLSDKHFDMREWDCGTSACIGGWIERLFKLDPEGHWQDTGEAVGLTRDQASELFFMDGTSFPMEKVGRREAVAVLDHYLDTGDVDWDAAIAKLSEQR